MVSIRKADAADSAVLAVLAESTFRETFGAANSPEDMDDHCRTSYGASIQALEISDPARATLLAECGGQLCGFAQLRWSLRPANVEGKSPGEIQRFYVAPAWHGQGIATELMTRCFAEFEERGTDVVWLGVWEKNSRALAFYRKSGFDEVGEQVFRLGSDLQRDILMSRLVRAQS
jgi:ribosomal protein S18 acetylase RimI-like enzyme